MEILFLIMERRQVLILINGKSRLMETWDENLFQKGKTPIYLFPMSLHLLWMQ